MNIDRRNFIKGGIAVGTLAALGSMTACSVPQGKSKSAEEGAKAKVPDHFTDGKWIGQAMGHRDDLTVQIEVRDGDISNISMLRCDETIGIGTVAAPMMVKRIMQDKNLDVDTISGATHTSMAVKNAIREAITAAGGDSSAYEKGAPAKQGGTTHTEDVDVVVVGAGTAGLIAAVRLLEAGKKVTVIEKLDIAGGSGPMTYSGVISVGSDLQKNYALGRVTDANKADFDMDAKIAMVKSYNTPENNRFGGEVPYQTALYENSSKLVDWMHKIGVGFYTMGSTYGTTPTLSPGMYMGGAGICMQFMADRIVALGGELNYSTRMTELIQDASGAVTGVKAEGTDGSTWTINAKAVCLTTGGFAANKDLIAQYYPQYSEFSFNCCPGSEGDGLIAAQKAGAAIECMGRDLGAFNATTPEAAGSRFELAFVHMFAPGVMVNDSGNEFGQGSLSHAAMTQAICDKSNGGRFFHITDHAGAITLEKMDSWNSTDYACLFNRGDIVKYDSIDEMATALNLPNLKETVEKHNQHALAGDKDEFGRACTFINENEGVYAISCMPTLYVTTGGIAIDTSCHVLNESGAAIPGLYAAGDVCGSIEEKDGNVYGYGFDSALTYGFIMGDTVAAEN